MRMIDIPKELEKYLLRDETVDNQFGLKDQTVYASKNRLFLAKGNKVRDISYIHISSIELETKPTWSRVIWGIILVGMTFIPWGESTPLGRLFMSYGTFSTVFTLGIILLGIFLFVAGFLWKNHYIELNVAGMSKTVVLRGDKDNTNDLFRLVNERRFNASNINSNEFSEETEIEQ
ncbi:hypothetical protein ACFLTR_00370 [Chloroflexota bacterium]